MDKIKVLFPFVGDTLGGSHISALSLINSLPIERFEATILIHKKGKLSLYLDAKSIPYYIDESLRHLDEVSVVKKIYMSFFGLLKRRRFIQKNGFDLVHTNDLRMHYTWVFPCLFSTSKHLWHQRTVSRRGVRLSIFSRKLVTITEFCRASFPYFVSEHAEVVADPVSISAIPRRANHSFKGGAVKIAWVGNITKQKRLDTAINVIFYLKHTFPEVELLVFGETREPVFSEVKELIEEFGLQKNVTFMGVKTPIEKWLVQADLLLATAENEGMGRTLIEAMLLGLPVVASDHGGHREVIDDGVTGVLIPLEDRHAYGKAISSIFENSEYRNSIVGAAKNSVETRYSTSRHVEKIISIYYKCLS